MSFGQDNAGDTQKPTEPVSNKQEKHTQSIFGKRQAAPQDVLDALAVLPPDSSARMKRLAGEEGKKQYSPDPHETTIPEKPTVVLNGQSVNFQELYERRDPITGIFT